MTKILISLGVITLLASAAPSAFAQGTGRGPVAAACSAEIGRYCAQMTHVGRQVRACLQAHGGELSADCRTALDTTGYGRRWQ